ncbi:Stk1 family PASTA domain-containing Ser/Thr kinase [[Pseudopropionibacterium] massiliense]|uniref:Stk1 family PASTA domain-containing Ser/Thr kinase n=1 Tax=[Pseudopropionibacterium] massiliense TaxID=2220000 RepID=UPI001FEB7DD3|nr:Stk1 family PASTA domain-containing Ser/Thr kinase [[Pseudopropionibacterium] massiliense]
MTERGTLLGERYELDQIIGRGGMAEVWRARDLRLVRDVAIKRLRIDLASDPTFQARFRREAQSAAGLNHPNIVAVYDTGEERDTKSDVMVPYIVMELVEGVTLREVLRNGRKIVPARALEFTAGVLDALSYSHRAGIIHRDIKPANVMLTPAGTVKVMDFGIARAVADTSATMTQTAAVIGTAQYLSPEQARGEKVDQRSDLYSVGCLLYELLCSEPPFKGDSPVSVAYQHVRETPVPPSQRDPEVTPAMDAITLKALAKSPNDRYQDAREFREDILRALNGQPVMAAYSSPVEMPTTVMPSPARRAAPSAVTTPADAKAAEATSVNGAVGTVEPVEAEEEPKKKRKALVVVSVLVGLLVIGIATAVYMVLNSGPKQVAVPNVVGALQASAEATLKEQGFETKVETVESDDANKGKVVDTDPKAGVQATSGSTVTLKVGVGPNQVQVPDVKGKSFDEASKALKDAGFTGTISKADMDPAKEAADAVKDQAQETEPAAGQAAAPDQEITVRIATGKSAVPDFSGMTADEARAAATEKGFRNRVSVVEKESTAQAAGKVFEQDPEEGTALERKSGKITVTIAKAAPTTAKMPNLVGMDENQALQAFKSAGFTSSLRITKVQTSEHPADKVYFQSSPENTELDKNAEVSVEIAIPPQQNQPTASPSGQQTSKNPAPSPTPSKTG